MSASGQTKSALTTWIGVIVVFIGIVAPFFLSRYQIGLATQIMIFGMLAMSIDILVGFTGRTSLGHGAIFGTSTYVVLYCITQAGLSPYLAVALGIVSATVLAAIFALLAVRTNGVYFLLLTLALGMIVWGICLRWTQVTGGENGLRGDVRPKALADYKDFYWFILALAVAVTYGIRRFVQSPFGLTLRGIRDSDSRMRSLGYNVPLHLFIGFTVSGFFAGVAGAVYAFFNNFVSPSSVALTQSVEALLMAIIGGVGTLYGSFIGASALIALQNLVSSHTERWQTVLGITFTLIMIFAPEGIVGKIRAMRAKK
jgi:branched-chain amino acid transport system permease protein